MYWTNNKLLNAFIILITVFILFHNSVFAHPKAAQHDKELMSVLFEPGFSKYKSTKVKNAVNAIEAASQLTIDQFGGTGKDNFLLLKEYGALGLTWSFSDIDYSVDIDNNNKIISAKTHRKYTHQGWDIEEIGFGTKNAVSFWKKRKKVLLNTVNTVFDFDTFSNPLRFDPKCDAFCGLVYYVHILGDYDEADDYKKLALVIPLAGRNDKYDMVSQLKKHLDVLFSDCKDSPEYKALIRDIDSIEKNASKIYRSTGGVNTDQKFEDYKKCSKDLLNSLQNHIPPLLKQEPFFSDVFY